MGTNAKPTSLKIIEGNLGRRPLPKNEPRPRPTAPGPMEGLEAAEKKVFGVLAKRLARIGIATEVDGDTLSILTQLRERIVYVWDRLRQAQKKLSRVEKEGGDPEAVDAAEKRVLSWMAQERFYSQMFRVAAAEFGMTPRGRVGLVVKSEGGDTGDEDLLT